MKSCPFPRTVVLIPIAKDGGPAVNNSTFAFVSVCTKCSSSCSRGWENRGRHMSHCCAVVPIENCRESSSGMNLAQVGRPRIDVSSEQIECLRSLGFTLAIVADFAYTTRKKHTQQCRYRGLSISKDLKHIDRQS